MKKIYKILIPIIIILSAACAYALMIHYKKKPRVKPIEKIPVTVKVISAQPRDMTMYVKSRGTVRPRTETILMAEISGRIATISRSFHTGGIFKSGDIIMELENGDYQDAVVRSRADVARARLKLAREEALAVQARKEWLELGRGSPGVLVLREPQIKEARAEYQAEKAQLKSDLRNLDRTVIRAPYLGIIYKKEVDVGQYVSPGTPLATIFGVDYAEIRLPVTSRDLAYLELPKSHISSGTHARAIPVKVFGDLAGTRREWTGSIHRTEGVIDSQSRVIYLVAQIPDPYAVNPDSLHHPLPMGLFVEAEITGIHIQGVFALPRKILRTGDTILLVTEDNRIQSRKIRIFKSGNPDMIIRNGIKPGDRICVTPLEYVVENMPVRPFPENLPPMEMKMSRGGLS